MNNYITIKVPSTIAIRAGMRHVDFGEQRSYRIVGVRGEHELDVAPWRWYHAAAAFPRWTWYRFRWWLSRR